MFSFFGGALEKIHNFVMGRMQAKAARSADRVLLDAPCSGFGVLSKRADLRWRRTPEDLQQLTNLQDDLLEAAASLHFRPCFCLHSSTPSP
jgi:16S rRNA C967 or C1407 C5-methylase (RsmB/RsmF family)